MDKKSTDFSPTKVHKRGLVDHRDHIILMQWKTGAFTKSEIAWIFNISRQLVDSIINK